MDVGSWLEGLGLGHYRQSFADNHIDGETLVGLTNEDLKKLGVSSLGHRKKLLTAIGALVSVGDTPERPRARDDAAVPAPTTSDAEHRHLTVLFCDLVGSTALAERLDPEDMREIIGRFQATCAEQVQRYDGFVARYMGDGLLVYFGYPQAHEDSAERAIRAGLDTVAAMGQLNGASDRGHGIALAVRVGIATGPVVVGDLLGDGPAEERTVVGGTPNLAARLQTLAEPDTVVIGPETRRIAGDRFDYADLGQRTLKGFAEPVPVWRVIAAKEAETRFDAVHRSDLAPIIGRDEEIEVLVRRWQRAKRGDGQVVLLCGEPGIGKSRIAQALRERIDEAHVRVRYQCSPNSALHPVIEQLKGAAGISRDDSSEEKIAKLEAMLHLAMDDVEAVAPLFAALLSIPADERYAALDISPEQVPERTLSALLQQMEWLAARQPMLAVFEDVHWIDPTSLDLLDRALERVQALPILIIVTFRPDFEPAWVGQAHVTLLTLNRISRRDCAAIVQNMTDGRSLPDDVLDQIIAKTDGVPLFIEELTRTVIDSGLLDEREDRYVLSGPLPPLAIPSSLHDSLMARLDRMSKAKDVAQAAAAIGREFSFELLAFVTDRSDDDLEDALTRLCEAELVSRRGAPPNTRFAFKHALVRDAAYNSLLKSKRRDFHERIATALEQRFPDVVASQPELLAHHHTVAGSSDPAIEYWQRAGQLSLSRGASNEAVRHFRRALDLIRDLPDTTQRKRREIALLNHLSVALVHATGQASNELEEAYERALQLCDETADTNQKFVADWGLWHLHLGRANYEKSREICERLTGSAEYQEDPDHRLQSCHADWSTRLFLGEHEKTLALCEHG